jgi:dTDP-4-amino-4,6-dideoxygalactose transaminase
MSPLRVPLADLARLHAPLRDQLVAAATRVIDSGRYVLGDEVAAFERAAAALCNAAEAVGVSSGSDALLATLMALGVGPGDEVVTPAFTFIAAAEAVARLGARPVFCDVGDDGNLDPDDALARTTPRTRLFLPVALYGRRPRLEALAAAGLPVVLDAAQAIGAPALLAGARVATFSFFPSKNLGALGDGGLVATDDAALAGRVRLLRVHHSQPKYVHEALGGNFRLDALQAALLATKLPHLEAWNGARRANARFYREALADLDGVLVPDGAPGHVWHQFTIRVLGRVPGGRRDALGAHLAARGVETAVYYPLPLHLQPCFRALGGRPGDLPRAEAWAREALSLPVHPALDQAQLAHVVESVRAFMG